MRDERKKQARSHVRVSEFFFLHSLLFATSFFLSISEKCSYIRDCSCMCTYNYTSSLSVVELKGQESKRHPALPAHATLSVPTLPVLQVKSHPARCLHEGKYGNINYITVMYMYCVALPRCLFDLACFFLPSFFISLTCTCFNPPSQFSRLGIQVSLAIICLFVWAMVGWVALPFFSFLFFFKLVCYAHVFPCRSTTQ